MTYWVETKSSRFSCPVKFATLAEARRMAEVWRKEGAFRVDIYALAEGECSGTLVE